MNGADSPMATVRLKHVIFHADRHGNPRWYFRRGSKGAWIRLEGEPGSEEFASDYKAAFDGRPTSRQLKDAESDKPAPAVPAPKPVKAGTLRWLCNEYLTHSADLKRLDEVTRRRRRSILETICVAVAPDSVPYGDKGYAGMRPKHVRRFRDMDVDVPEAGNARVKALRQVFKFAIDEEHHDENPARDVGYVKTGSTGFHAWSVEEVAQFEARHPIGTKARLALALLLYTGQRRSDVVQFGRQHGKATLTFTQHKNRNRKPKRLTIPILPELQAVIDASPCGALTYLETGFKQPFTSNGFGNWFKDRCVEAGLPHCSAHGLRKAGAAIAAENGASERTLMAIFGWDSSKQATGYTRSADQVKLAAAGMGLLVRGPGPEQKV